MDVSPLIRDWARRARWQHSLRLVGLGLAAGLGIALLIGLAARLEPILTRPALIVISLVLALLGIAGALLWPWLRTVKKDELAWARDFDSRFGLSERLSTSLEVTSGAIRLPNETLRKQQRADTERSADEMNGEIKQRLPLKLNWRDIAVAAAFAFALAVIIALPNPQEQTLADRAKMQETMKRESRRLDQAKETIKSSTLSEQDKKAALDAIDQAQSTLNDNNSSPEQSMAAINDAQSKLDALKDQAAQQSSEDLREAGQSLTADELTNTLADSLQRGDFDRASEQMRQMSQKGDQQLTPDEGERVARQLEQIARGVQNSDPAMSENLRNAAQQLREGRTEEARESLERAAQSIDQTSARTEQNEGLSEAQQRAEEARRAISQASQQQNARGEGEQAQNGQRAENGQNSQQGEGNQQGQEGQDGQQGQTGQQAGQQGQQGQQAGQQGQTGQQGATSQGQAGQADGGARSQSQSQGGQASRSGRSEDSGSDNSVYAPGRVNAQGKQVVLPEAQGENAPDPNGRRNTAPGGNTTVTYEDVYKDYALTADEAIDSGQVPADRRDYVRDYFSSLDPLQQNAQNSP